MKLLIIIPSIVACVMVAVRIVGRSMEWDRLACEEHDARLREITRRHVRTARRKFEQYEMN